MKLYLIHHAHAVQNKRMEAAGWQLSPDGINQAKRLAAHTLWDDVDCIILSSEPKTRLTVAPVLKERDLPIWVEARFGELRQNGPDDDYTTQVIQAFAHPDVSAGKWEPASLALNRFLDGISLLRKRFVNENLALVGHGLSFCLYRAYLLGQPRAKVEDWQRLAFGSVALVNPISERLRQDFSPIL